MVAPRKNTKNNDSTMAKETELPYGFVPVIPQKHWLDTAKLSLALARGESSHRATMGSIDYNKLVKFCDDCLNDDHAETIVTVVGKDKDTGDSFQCRFSCNDAIESFTVSGQFLRVFETLETKAKKKSPATMLATA